MKRHSRKNVVLLLGTIVFGVVGLTQAHAKDVGSVVIAQVGNIQIEQSELDEVISQVRQGQEKITPQLKLRLLQGLVNGVVLYQEALRQGIDKDLEMLKLMINKTEPQRREMLTKAMAQIEMEKIEVTPEEIQQWYDANQNKLIQPEQRRVSEIVVDKEGIAKDVLIEILKNGKNFSELAQTYSVAPSKANGGDAGYIPLRENVKFPRYLAEVFSKSPGEISYYFKGPDKKFYIIKVEEIKEPAPVPLNDSLKKQIVGILRQQKLGERIEAMRKNYKIKIYEDRIN